MNYNVVVIQNSYAHKKVFRIDVGLVANINIKWIDSVIRVSKEAL